jgi:hypothetical protein
MLLIAQRAGRVGCRALRPAALAGVVSVVVGCAAVGTHPDDLGDTCAAERTALRGAQDYYTQAVVKGAVVGGVVGALTGWLAGESGKSTALGAAAGAVAGGIGGYYLAKRETARDAASLSGAVLQDVVRENEEIDRATLSFARLRECRFATARQVKADYAARRIDRATAAAQLDALSRRFAEDVTLAEAVGAKMGERSREFQYASDEILKEDPAARAYVARQQKAPARPTTSRRPTAAPRPLPADAPPAAAVADATETNQIKQKAFAEEVAVAKAEADAAFSLEGKVGVWTPECTPCRTV